MIVVEEYMGYDQAKRGQGEFYLTDVISMLNKDRVHISDAEFVDAGSANLRLIASMMFAGVPAELIEQARAFIGIK